MVLGLSRGTREAAVQWLITEPPMTQNTIRYISPVVRVFGCDNSILYLRFLAKHSVTNHFISSWWLPLSIWKEFYLTLAPPSYWRVYLKKPTNFPRISVIIFFIHWFIHTLSHALLKMKADPLTVFSCVSNTMLDHDEVIKFAYVNTIN